MTRASAILAACALGACGFEMKLGGTELDGGGSDGGGGSDIMMMIDAPLGPPVPCETPSAAGLVACFELEDDVTDGTLRDSSPAHVDATTTGLVALQRTKPATSAAADVTDLVSTYVPDSPSLDLASGYTVTMWIRLTETPSTSRVFGLYDHELQYAGAIGKYGNFPHLRCINTGAQYMYTTTVPLDTWAFIACTWNGDVVCAQYWSTTTDHERQCAQVSGIASGGNRGLAIGHLSTGGVPESPFKGALDSVQLYDHALTGTELCTMLGQPSTCWQ